MILEKEWQELSSFANQKDYQKSAVSESGTFWHIDHSLKVINAIYGALEKSNPAEYKWKFNFKKIYIFWKNQLPRGKAKAPKRVVAQTVITIESIENQLLIAKNALEKTKNLPKNAFFPHPYFGNLKKKEAEYFLQLHTEHHLKIIREILEK